MLTYGSVQRSYGTNAPAGFRQFSAKHGVARPQTCAVRLAHAIFSASPGFFRDVRAPSGVEWYGLPTRAADLAIVLNRKLGRARQVRREDIAGQKGIIFFDTIRRYSGTGHISLWDGSRVVDRGDYFSVSPRAYFWRLP